MYVNHHLLCVCVAAYQTNDGKPYILKVVREAEQRIASDFSLNHEYLPIDGLPAFTDASTAVMFGKEHPIVVNRKVPPIQYLYLISLFHCTVDYSNESFDLSSCPTDMLNCSQTKFVAIILLKAAKR